MTKDEPFKIIRYVLLAIRFTFLPIQNILNQTLNRVLKRVLAQVINIFI